MLLHLLLELRCLKMCEGLSVEVLPYACGKMSVGFTDVTGITASTNQLKIKEALHILWDKPILNYQVKHVNLKLFLINISM